MKTKLLLVYVLAISIPALVASGVHDYGKYDLEALDVSMARLLSKPEEYLGKKVRVVGVLYRDFESSYLFMSRDSLEGYDAASAVEMPVDAAAWPVDENKIELLNGCIVAAEGIVEIVPNRLRVIVKMKNVTRILSKSRMVKEPASQQVNPK